MNSKEKRIRQMELDLKKLEYGALGINSGLDISSHSLAKWMAQEFNHNFDAYDAAIDSVYNSTHIGGSQYHHLIDQQHSFLTAFEAVRDVKTDDSYVTELTQAGEHLLRDAATVSGISPFFSLTPEQFNNVAGIVKHIGISKPFLADALTVNGPEIIGGTVALAACLVLGNNPDPSRLSTLSGAYITSAASTANPLLLPIAACGLVYSLYKAEDKKDVLIKAGKGSLVSGSALLVGGLVGGPVWLGMIAAVGTAIAVKYSLDNPEKAFERTKQIITPATTLLRKVTLSYSGGH